MGGVVGMRRNDDLNSDYAFDVSDHNSGHPDISDYVLDIREHDFNGVGHQVEWGMEFSGNTITNNLTTLGWETIINF